MKVSVKKLPFALFLLFFCLIFVHYGLGKTGIIAYCIPVFVAGIIIISSKKIRMGNSTKWYLLFGIWVLLSELWAGDIIAGSDVRIETIKLCLIVVCMGIFIRDEVDIISFLKVLIFATIYLDLAILVTTPIELFGTDNMGDVIGVHNNAAANLSVCCFGASGFLFLSSTGIRKKIYAFVSLFFCVFVIITQSRKSIVMLILTVCLAIIMTNNASKRIKRIFLAIVIALIVLIFLMNSEYVINNYYIRMLDLFTSNTTDGSVLERSHFRDLAFQMMFDHPIIGLGMDGFRTALGEMNYVHVTYSHCGYSEIGCNYGLIGMALYYIPVIILTKRMWKYRHNLFAKLIFIELFLFILGDYGTISYYSRLIIPYIYLMMQGGTVIIDSNMNSRVYDVITKETKYPDYKSVNYNNIRT